MLRHVAAAYSIKDEKKYRFQIIAYQKAADAIEQSTSEVKDLIKEDRLKSFPGVGPSIRAHLTELMESGKVRHFDDVMKDIPLSLFPLMDIPSFGPKKAYRLVSHFKLTDPKTVIADVKKLARTDKIADLEGFGEKSQSDILRALEEFGQGVDKVTRMALPFAGEIADKLVQYMKMSKDVKEVYPLGSLRRRKETIGDVDIAVATNEPQKYSSISRNTPIKNVLSKKATHQLQF